MNVFSFDEWQILLFFSALVRVSCLFLLLPFFGDSEIPPLSKILLTFSLTLILFPLIQAGTSGLHQADYQSTMGIVMIAAKEAAVGLTMGFVGKIFFESLSFAFAFMGMQMGFSTASMYDTHMEANTPVISRLIMIIAYLLFLGMDGHHMLIRAVAESFHVVPVGGIVFSKAICGYVMDAATRVFWITVRISAPMALVIFLVNCAFGIVAKAVPQINVLVVSFTVNILVGFVVLFLTLPVFGTSIGSVFQEMMERMVGVLKYLA